MKKQLLLLAVLSVFGMTPATAQLKINEYSCANVSTFTDNNGNYEDWVELYNPGSSAVALSGYYLSDDAADPQKWQFPSTAPSVPAGGVVRVICSGADIIFGVWIHTSFKLTQCKPDGIILSNPGGSMVDSVQLRRNQDNHSWGRNPDGASSWAVYTTPTPNALNSTGTPMQTYATSPQFSVAPGFYPGAQTISLSSPDPGVTIRYTTDGSEPTAASTQYASPLNVSGTTVIRAKAFSSNSSVPASFIESNTYFIGVTHTTGVISVYGDQTDDLIEMGGWSVSEPRSGIEYFDKTGVFKTEATGTTNKHGNDSWAYDQRGFDFVTHDQYGYNYVLKNKFFRTKNRTKFQRLIFKAAANDNYPFESGAHIRDSYVHHLSQHGDLHLDERSWEPAVVYLNGRYWGVYDIREKVDDADFTEYYYDQPDKNNWLQFIKTWGGTWSEYGGAQAQADWSALVTYIQSNSMAVQANYDYVDSLLNVKSLADYFILNSWAVTTDWLNWNTGWWRGKNPASNDGKKWRYILWDNDACFGHYINYTGVPDTSPNADPCNAEQLPDPGGQGHTTIMTELLNNPGFHQYYVNRYADLLNTTLKCDTALAVLNMMIGEIDPEMTAQCTKWGGSYSGWQGNVTTLRNFITARCTAIEQGMIDCYNLSGPYDITIDVAPAGAGTVDLNSLTLDNYPWTGTYYGGIDIILKATPSSNAWTFDYWEMANTPNPSTTDDSVTVNLTQNDNIIAHFKADDVLNDVFIATGFSPNGDGINDHLVMHGLGGAQSMEFVVYNRWGQRVYETTDPNFSWDGTAGGKLLDAGVYAYKLTAMGADGIESIKTGNITLMR